jgi:cell division protein FtsI (penicillin-binding protein 3)
MPDVRGMGLKDALYALESRGLKVSFTGAGAVCEQSIEPGTVLTGMKSVKISLK